MPPEIALQLPVPKTLEGWLKQLNDLALPVPIASHNRVRHALNDSRLSMRDIANMMQDSPALVLSVLREANLQSAGITEPAESLEVAINRLGLKRTEGLLNRCLPWSPRTS